MKIKKILSLVLQIVAAIILLQTLFFKFTAHPQSVELFTKLGVEPWGRIGTGILELHTSVLLLLPQTKVIGAFLGIGIMMGAIFSHLFVIGIETSGDGGLLFGLAIIVLICCAFILVINKKEFFDLRTTFIPSRFRKV